MSTTFAPINRISHTKYDPNLAVTGDEQLSYYSYDIHGNVHTLINENRLLANIQQDLKKTTYKYDLVSGNVNEVWYQKGQHDQLGHRYRGVYPEESKECRQPPETSLYEHRRRDLDA